MLFWDSIKSSTYPADFKAYLEQYPDCRFRRLASIRLTPISSQSADSTAPPLPKTDRLVKKGSYPYSSEPMEMVQLPSGIKMGKYEVTRSQFEVFVKETGYTFTVR